MSNYTYYVLLVLLFLAIAIYNMYRLKKKRDELRYYYDKKEKHRKIKIGSSHQMKKIIGEPGGGREYDFTNFPKSKKEVEEITEKSISENNPFSNKIRCLAKHYFTKLPLFPELIWPLMLKKVRDLPIYENREELQEALEEIKNTFGDDFEIIQNTTLINLMSFFDELREFHTMYGLSPEKYYQDILKRLKWQCAKYTN